MPPAPLSIRDYATYLIGNREAILRIATARGAVVIGALLVLSAAFAREYDGEDLRAEPWHLAIPFAASLATSFVLFSAVWLAGRKRRAEPIPFWKSYRGFLALYWATAPLAWLYAIPVERFLPIMTAIWANYALLLIVSIWRVALITRAIAVVNSCGAWTVLPLVLLISSIVATIVGATLPIPVLALMGGIRPPDDEMLALSLGGNMTCIALLAIPVSLILCIAASKQFRDWRFPREDVEPGRVGPGLWAFAIASIAVWALFLPGTQLEQKHRHLVEEAVSECRFEDAISVLQAHPRAQFPPHWRPPPWISRPGDPADAMILLNLAEPKGAPSWVIEVYADAVLRLIDSPRFMRSSRAQLLALTEICEHDDQIIARVERWVLTDAQLDGLSEARIRREATLAELRRLAALAIR